MPPERLADLRERRPRLCGGDLPAHARRGGELIDGAPAAPMERGAETTPKKHRAAPRECSAC